MGKLFLCLLALFNALAIAHFYGGMHRLAERCDALLDQQALYYARDIAACRVEAAAAAADAQQCHALRRGVAELSAMPMPLPQPSGRIIM